MSLFAINGWIKLEIDFQLDFFITDPDHSTFKYKSAEAEYFPKDGTYVTFFSNSTDIDYYSEES